MRYADVDDGLVQAAPVADVGERHEGVADVDDQGAGVGADGALASGGADLEAADVIVVEDGERVGVAMQAVSMATPTGIAFADERSRGAAGSAPRPPPASTRAGTRPRTPGPRGRLICTGSRRGAAGEATGSGAAGEPPPCRPPGRPLPYRRRRLGHGRRSRARQPTTGSAPQRPPAAPPWGRGSPRVARSPWSPSPSRAAGSSPPSHAGGRSRDPGSGPPRPSRADARPRRAAAVAAESGAVATESAGEGAAGGGPRMSTTRLPRHVAADPRRRRGFQGAARVGAGAPAP